jgi:Tfp pilus assembly protein PilV
MMKRNDKSPRPRAGFTIIETLLAVVISTILFIGILFVYNAYAKMTQSQGKQADTQEQLMLVRHIMEKDIHMAGYNLPGNGIMVSNAYLPNPTPVFLSNQDNKTTMLSGDAQIGDTKLFVNDASGVSSRQWVCLSKDTMTGYKELSRIGLRGGSASCDTLFLKYPYMMRFWDHALTQVTFTRAVYYSIDRNEGSARLIRHDFKGDQPLGPSIDSLSYSPKDTSGILSWYSFPKIQILQVTVAAPCPGSSARTRLSKCFDVMIRN